MNRTPKSVSAKLKNEIRLRDNSVCIYCGEMGQVVDHVWPTALGGKAMRGNLVLACISCNARKRRDCAYFIDMMAVAFKYLLSIGESLDWIQSFEEATEIISRVTPLPPLSLRIPLRVYNNEKGFVVKVYDDIAICDCEKFEEHYWCNHTESVYQTEQRWVNQENEEPAWENRPHTWPL